jgi:hypothetical protein
VKNILSVMCILFTIIFGNGAFAVNINYDGLRIDVPSDIDWSLYKQSMFAWKQQNSGAMSDGDEIERFFKKTVISDYGDQAFKIAYMGLTEDYPHTLPVAPASCAVALAGNDKLYVFGTISIARNGAQPELRNLHCKFVKAKN